MADKKVSRIKIPPMFVIFAVVWPFLLLLLFIGADAKEEDPVEKIIFLLDCSQSMKNIDNRFMIADFVAEAVAIAPENIQIGVAAYDEEIRFSFAPGSKSEKCGKF